MKRLVIVAVLLIGLVGAAIAAQRSGGPTANQGLSLAGGPTLASFESGGFFEVGFPLLEGAKGDIRDYVSLNGYGTSPIEGGIVSVSDKVTFGGVWPTGYESYGFIAAGFGLIGTTGGISLSPPFLIDVETGGGMQLDLSRHLSYFMEAGGGWNFPTSRSATASGPPFTTGYALIRTGFRVFL